MIPYRRKEKYYVFSVGLGCDILCVFFYTYDYIIFSYIAFFFAVAGFVIHHKESNK